MAFNWVETAGTAEYTSNTTISNSWLITQIPVNVGTVNTYCNAVRISLAQLADGDPSTKFALYSNREDGGADYPDALLYQSGVETPSGTGLLTHNMSDVVSLSAGINWLCVRCPSDGTSPVNRALADSAQPSTNPDRHRSNSFGDRQVDDFDDPWPDPFVSNDAAGPYVYAGLNLNPDYIPFLGGGGPPRPDELRYLGIDADKETLYITSLQTPTGGTENLWTLYTVDLSTFIASGDAQTFGDGVFGDIDLLNKAIFPAIMPGQNGIVYLFGRDGNDTQVQYNDTNGTAGWTDIGPGTATWATDKYAVNLSIAPTSTNDIIVVFYDNDVYRTIDGTANWTKTGDASAELRAAARVATRTNEIITGGTAAGTVEWSNNLGVSFSDISGTALGTINAFEVNP